MTGDIGIRELKAHLSEIVERVSLGERVRITDRGKPKALIVPMPNVDRIATGFREGWLTQGVAFGRPLPPPSNNLPRPKRMVSSLDILTEDREQ